MKEILHTLILSIFTSHVLIYEFQIAHALRKYTDSKLFYCLPCQSFWVAVGITTGNYILSNNIELISIPLTYLIAKLWSKLIY